MSSQLLQKKKLVFIVLSALILVGLLSLANFVFFKSPTQAEVVPAITESLLSPDTYFQGKEGEMTITARVLYVYPVAAVRARITECFTDREIKVLEMDRITFELYRTVWIPKGLEPGQYCVQIRAWGPANEFNQTKEDIVTFQIKTVDVEYQFIIDSTVGGQIIEPGEGTFTYLEGEAVNLKAVPDYNYEFVRWQGQPIDGLTNPQSTIIIEDDYSLTAIFEEIIIGSLELRNREEILTEIPEGVKLALVHPQEYACDGVMEIGEIGDSSSKVDFFFMGYGFETDAAFKSKLEELIFHSVGLFNTEPFKSNRSKFNIWAYRLVDPADSPGYFDYPGHHTFEIDVSEEEWEESQRRITNIAENCLNFYNHFIYLSTNKFGTHAEYGGNIYQSLTRSDNPLVLTHEMGHAFAELLDEYVETREHYPTYGLSYPREPNCADSQAQSESWWGNLLGMSYDIYEKEQIHQIDIYPGCSYVETNFRPHPNTIMRNFDSAGKKVFGPINEIAITEYLNQFRDQNEPLLSLLPSPTIHNFHANRKEILGGQSTTLHWFSTYAVNCYLENQRVATNDEDEEEVYSVSPVQTTTYELICEGPYGARTSSQITVTVKYKLEGAIIGIGSGFVYVNPPIISYDRDFTETYEYKTDVTLKAINYAGSYFIGWGGDCVEFRSDENCILTMDNHHSISASFGKVFPNPPSTPTNVACQPISSNEIRISWDSVEEATKYEVHEIYNCFFGNINWCLSRRLLGTVDHPQTFWSHIGLLINTTYRYRVRAVNPAGASSYSDRFSCVAAEVEQSTLKVKSSSVIGLWISSGSGHSGSTNYTKSVTAGTSVSLAAPASSGDSVFCWWSGCTYSTSRTINFSMPSSNITCEAFYAPVKIGCPL